MIGSANYFVKKRCEQDLDTIERAIEALNEVAPQVHIKSRFIEVHPIGRRKKRSVSIGISVSSMPAAVWFDRGFWQQCADLNHARLAANPLGTFPVNTTSRIRFQDRLAIRFDHREVCAGSAPTIGTITGILTDPEFPFRDSPPWNNVPVSSSSSRNPK